MRVEGRTGCRYCEELPEGHPFNTRHRQTLFIHYMSRGEKKRYVGGGGFRVAERTQRP